MARRILVVDDEAGIRDLVGSYLRNEGFDVDDAADGEDGEDGAQGPRGFQGPPGPQGIPGTAAGLVASEWGVPLVSPTATNDRVWELGLSPAPALQIQADLAVGEADLDLIGLALRVGLDY